MRQNKIMAVLLAVLLLAVGLLSVNLIILYRNVYRIPDQAVEDLCRVLAKEGIYLEESLVPRGREDGIIYVSDGTGYEENAALLLSGSEIKSTYTIPDGKLFLHYNGDRTEFTDGFRFHYSKSSRSTGETDGVSTAASTDGRECIVSPRTGEERSYRELTAGLPELSVTGDAAMAAKAFLDKQDDRLGGSVQVETVIASVHGEEGGRAYVRCLRRIDGVEITENEVICRLEQGTVAEACGKWCFMTFGQSYMAQLSDITNILFMMKRNFGGAEEDAYCRVTGLEQCYSLYFFAQDEGFCLIPCWRVETESGGVLVFSALDGTLYTKIGEIF